jgi:hypothetical protein
VVWNCDETGFCVDFIPRLVIAQRGLRNLYQVSHAAGYVYTTVLVCCNGTQVNSTHLISTITEASIVSTNKLYTNHVYMLFLINFNS